MVSKEGGDGRYVGGHTILYLKVVFPKIHSFSILSDDRFKASSKRIPPHSAI